MPSPIVASEVPPSATLDPTPEGRIETAAPEDLVAFLDTNGIHVAPPDGSVPLTDGDVLAAIDAARAQFGPDGTAAAFPATVTVDGYHTGDENSPLVIDGRQAIIVQITGLDMPPIGGPYGDPPAQPEEYNHELIVLVDAKTGEYLMASTDR